jgi:hypothetical protein
MQFWLNSKGDNNEEYYEDEDEGNLDKNLEVEEVVIEESNENLEENKNKFRNLLKKGLTRKFSKLIREKDGNESEIIE